MGRTCHSVPGHDPRSQWAESVPLSRQIFWELNQCGCIICMLGKWDSCPWKMKKMASPSVPMGGWQCRRSQRPLGWRGEAGPPPQWGGRTLRIKEKGGMPLLSLVCSGKKIGVENCASESGNRVSMCACLCKEQVRGADGEGGGEVDVALIPAALQHLRHAPHPTAAADSGKSEGHEGAKRRPLRRPPRAIQRRRRVWEAAVGVQPHPSQRHRRDPTMGPVGDPGGDDAAAVERVRRLTISAAGKRGDLRSSRRILRPMQWRTRTHTQQQSNDTSQVSTKKLQISGVYLLVICRPRADHRDHTKSIL